jgi:predicted nucleic acid-binding protein
VNPVFADTQYYLALLNPRDAWHARAVLLSIECSRPIILTDYIVLELGNSLLRAKDRELFVQLVGHLQGDATVTIVEGTRSLQNAGLQLFAERPDKEWSLTDCISFVVMKENGLTDVLTADRHFEQAGFTILLK